MASQLIPAPRKYVILMWGSTGVMQMDSQKDLCQQWENACQARLKDGKWADTITFTGIGDGRVETKLVVQCGAVQGVALLDQEVRLEE